MFFPHHNVVILQLLNGSFRQFYRTRQFIRNDTQATRAECLCFGNHAPQHIGSHIFFQELLTVCQGNQLNRVRMHRCLIRRVFAQQVIVHTQVRRQFRCRSHRLISDNHIAGTVIQDTDNRAILHRPTSQIAHALISSLAVEIASFQIRKSHTDRFNFTDRFHLTDFIVYKLCDINSDITTVTFSPSFLPQVSGNFCYLVYFFGKSRTIL